MALTRIDSYLVDLDSLGGITFDDQAGTPTLKVDAVNHRVGIGTSAPSNLLNLAGDNTAFRGQLSLQTLTASNFSQITFYDRTTLGAQIYQGYGSSNELVIQNVLNGPFAFGTNNTERVRIDSSGNVGIGTTSPTTRLQVDGSTLISGTSTLDITNLYGSVVKDVALTVDPSTYSVSGLSGAMYLKDDVRPGSAGNVTHTSLYIEANLAPTATNSPPSGKRAIYNLSSRGGSTDSYGLGSQVALHNVFAHESTLNTSASTFSVTGVRNDANVLSGSVSNIYGTYNYTAVGNFAIGAAAVGVGSLYGTYNSINVGNKSDYITTAYGWATDLIVNNTGSITNYYGMYLGTKAGTGTVTNYWSVYSNDSLARMYHAGNVGIGTTNPTRKLSIYDSTPSAAAITDFVLWSDGTRTSTLNQTGSSYSYAGVGSNEMWYYSNGSYSAITLGSDGAIPIKFVSGGGERVRITSSGNVGVGITNPIRGLHLARNGAGEFIIEQTDGRPDWRKWNFVADSGNSLTTGNFYLRLLNDAGDATTRTVWSYNGNSNYHSLTGNVGIGTTNPLAPLHISGKVLSVTSGTPTGTYNFAYNAHIDSGTTGLQITSGTNYSYFYADSTNVMIGSNSGTTGNKVLISRTCPDNSLLINSSGNVGIGTTSPSTRLHVRQSADFDGITLTHAARPGIWKIYHSGTSSENIAFTQNNGTTDAVSYVAGRDMHEWYTAGTARMNINSSGSLYVAGNVGIGTAAATKFDVLGFSRLISDSSAPASTASPNCYVAAGNSSDTVAMEVRQGRFNKDVLTLTTNQNLSASLLSVIENGGDRFRINGVTSSSDAGNAVFYTGSAFDSSNYFIAQNHTNSYGRIGFIIRGKTFNGVNTPSANDAWSLASGRSTFRFDAYLTGDAGFDTKFSIQHLLANSSNAAIGDLGFHAKGFSTTSPAMVLTAAGNVGIGTTNPTAKLEVKSQINVIDPSNNVIQGLTGTGFGYSPSSYPVLQVGGGSYRTVSIGHDPSSNTNGSFTGSGIEVIFKNGVRFMTPNDANTSWNLSTLCMKDGNVGIGTTNPTANLDVRGGFYQANGQRIIRNSNQYYEVYPILHMYSDNGNPATTLLTINSWTSIYSTALITIEVWATHAISGLASYARGAALAHYNGTRSLSALTAVTSFGGFGVGTIAWTGPTTAGSTGCAVTYIGPSSNYTRSYIKITVDAHDGADISFSTSY